jgi:hypothetical protein
LLLCFKVERKVQSIFLPVIHQDCRRFIRFKVKRKVLLCWIRRLWPEDDIAFLHDPSEFYQAAAPRRAGISKFQHSILSAI